MADDVGSVLDSFLYGEAGILSGQIRILALPQSCDHDMAHGEAKPQP